MPQTDWRSRAGTTFTCEKQPATGTRGMVVTNHPLASAAGAEMLAAGGNAIDAAIAAFFTLTVVEPMMVGVLGGGMAHIRLADGTHHVHRRPEHGAARHRPHDLHARSERRARHHGHDRPQERRRPDRGRRARQPDGLVRGAAPLRHVLARRRHGAGDPPRLARLPRDALPARVRLRQRRRHGARCGDRARSICPDGAPIQPGTRLVTGDYAETLRTIAREGPDMLYGGALGRHYADHMAQSGGYLTLEDLTRYRTIDARGAARHLPRFRDRRPAAALIRPAAHHPDAEHPGGLRHRRAGLRHRPTRCTCWPRC